MEQDTDTRAAFRLSADRLTTRLAPTALATTGVSGTPADHQAHDHQARARSGLALCCAIKERSPAGAPSEYNIYLAGEDGLGRTYYIKKALQHYAKDPARTPPPDLCYVHDLAPEGADPDVARLLLLPAGRGVWFKRELACALADVREGVHRRLGREAMRVRLRELSEEHASTRRTLMGRLRTQADSCGVRVDEAEDGTLTLGMDDKSDVRGELVAVLERILDAIRRADETHAAGVARLRHEALAGLFDERLATLMRTVAQWSDVARHMHHLRADVLEHPELFFTPDSPEASQHLEESEEATETDHAGQPDASAAEVTPDPLPSHASLQARPLARYAVNCFVDNSAHTQEATDSEPSPRIPVIVEDHPTRANLLGSVERDGDTAGGHADIALIRPGSLHRASGGFLILRGEEVLADSEVWSGLLRALRAGTSRPGADADADADGHRSRCLRPVPVPLATTVVLIGTDAMYEELLHADPRFAKHFKIKAHMTDRVERTDANIAAMATDIRALAQSQGLLPLAPDALAALIDHASALAEDHTRLSLEYPRLRELCMEADATARMAADQTITAAHVLAAHRQRIFRANLEEQEFLTDYDRQIIKVPTGGCEVGRVNGLSVSWLGDHEFGLPHQIACAVGVGASGVIDLEREAELGGPIHTKAMMILGSYLLRLFAADKPLVFAGSLYFEQSYAEVEGDSASGAELAALLSALSGVPIDLSLAFTGAVNQSGHIMAVGGVSAKVKGFHQVCARRGLTGSQGVILPADNVENLFLPPSVVQDVQAGRFHVYAVASIEEALKLLTGMECGQRDASGHFPEGTLYRAVDKRLAHMARCARDYNLRTPSL